MRVSEDRRYREANAEAWTVLSRKGYDRTRDSLNTPAFMHLLGRVRGRKGLDVGCGEGHNTRLAARRGAQMTAIDISEIFIRHAREAEAGEPLGIRYLRSSGEKLPFRNRVFDFAMATMSLMDMAGQERVLREVHRVLRPGGFFQFSMVHPCFATPKWFWLRDESGRKTGLVVGDYFRRLNGEPEEWIFGAAPEVLKRRFPKFRIPRFTRTLSGWLNLVIDAGFDLERLVEPTPTDAVLRKYPDMYDARIIAYSLIVRGRKRKR